VVVVLIAVVFRWATAIRQSGVRAKTQMVLQSVAQAAAAYQQEHAVVPTIDDLLNTKLLDPAALREFSRCAPIGPSGGSGPPVLDAWLVQTVPSRAVRKGEAWGGPGETIDNDLPACRFVLMRDWTVRQIDEPTFQQSYAQRVRLTPLR
jgi:hypothetical protein